MRLPKFIRVVLCLSLILACWGFEPVQAPATGPKPKPEVQAIVDLAAGPAKEFKWDEVLKIYEEALKKAVEIEDIFGQGFCWQRIGNTFYAQGNLPKARDSFETAKGLFAKAGATENEIGMKGNLAVLKDNMGYPLEARPIYLEILAYYREKDNRRGIGNMLTNLAILSERIDEPAETLKYALEARGVYKQLNDKRWEGNALGLIAGAYKDLGRREEAETTFEEAARLGREGGFKSNEASALEGLGELKREKGDLTQALNLYRQALLIREETNDIRFQGQVNTSIGIVYDLLGRSNLAVECFRKAAELAKKSGSRPAHAAALNNLGVSLNQAKRNDEAKPVLLEALELCRSIGAKASIASCLGTLGNIYRAEKDFAKAAESLEEAKSIYSGLSRMEEIATLTDSLGSVYADQGKLQMGVDNYLRAIELYDQVNNRRFAAATYSNLGRAYKKMGRLQDAERSYARFVELAEDVRSRLGATSEGKSEFLSRRIESYHDYLTLLIERKKTSAAFDLAQQTKGRSLLDILAAGNIGVRQKMTPAELEEERRLRADADRLNAAMVREGAQNEVGAKRRFAALKVELEKAENTLSEFATKLFAEHPGVARTRSPKPATIAEVAANLPNDTVLLEYVAAKSPSVFIISSKGGKGSLTNVTLKTDRDTLSKSVEAFRKTLADPSKPYAQEAARLYKILIVPIEASIKGKKRLIICPDGPLWDVSFAALSNGKFLAERFEIEYAFSGTAYDAIMRSRRTRNTKNDLLIVANPAFGGEDRFGDNPLVPGQRPIEPPSRPIEPPSRPIDTPSRPIDTPSRPIEPPSRDLSLGMRAGIVDLPGTQKEANALAKLYPGAKVLTRANAQESSVVSLAPDFRLVHIATHAFFNDAAPLLSSVVLAIPNSKGFDGYLTARELFDLNLNAELVVLSACNTARGEQRSGEGIVGLSWALFAAGAPSQVVSQWSVDDRATAVLMKRFYAGMKANQSKGAALRAASLSLLNPKAPGNDKKWQHPYYWAPFILLGNWR